MISAKDAKLLARDEACRQIMDPIAGISWDRLQDLVETKNRKTFTPTRYRIGKIFACPDFSTDHAYFLCAVTAYDPHSFTGAVTFFRPTVKSGVFSLFPAAWKRETIEFNAFRNALVPLPYVNKLPGGRISLSIPLRSQILTYIGFGGDAEVEPSGHKLHALARAAYAMTH
jgi:hypothetical protein